MNDALPRRERSSLTGFAINRLDRREDLRNKPDAVTALRHRSDTRIAVVAGETPIRATLLGGASEDFNVMTRRGRCRADVKVWRYAVDWPSTPPHAALLLAVQGDWRCAVAGDAPTLLTPGSGLWWSPAAARPAISVQPQPGADDPALLAVMIEYE